MFYTGTGSSLQIGKESEYGTAVTPTALIDLTSESIKVAVEKGDEGSLLASKTPMSRDLLSITVSGSISFILRPEGAGTVFLLALGGTDTVASGEDGKFTHTMHLCEVNDNLPGATIIVDRKAKVMKYAGCTVSALSLECAAGDYVKATLDIQGVKEEAGTLNASLKSFTVPSYRCTAAVFTIGDEVYDISSSTVKIDNALETAPRTYSSGLYAGRPQHGRRSVTITFDIPYSEDVETLKSSFLTTEENAAVKLTFTSSDQDHKVEITMPNVSVNDVTANVGGTGILTASVSGEALSVGDTEPLEVVITDENEEAY